MLKKYQVTERTDGLWDVVEVKHLEEKKDVYFASVMPTHYPSQLSAAEAQELADELNEEHGYEQSESNSD